MLELLKGGGWGEAWAAGRCLVMPGGNSGRCSVMADVLGCLRGDGNAV